MTKFNNITSDTICSKVIPNSDKDSRYSDYGGLACMRVEGHQGDCISTMWKAAKADGVWCSLCRSKRTLESIKYHEEWCPLFDLDKLDSD